MSQSSPSTSPAAQPSPRRQRYLKWRKRLKRVTIGLFIAVIALRITMALLLRFTINQAAGLYGMDCDYSRVKMSLLGGFAQIWDMNLTPKGGGESILTIGTAGGDISPWDLLRGRLTIWRLSVQGLDVYVDRTADGRIPLIERFVQSKQATKPQRQAVATARGQLDFTSPLQAESISIAPLRLHVQDAMVQPAFRSTIEVSLYLNNLGSDTRPAKFELTVRSNDLLDELRIVGEGKSAGRNLAAVLSVKGWGANPKPLAPYLQLLGIRPTAEKIDVTAQITLQTKPASASLTAIQLHCELAKLSMVADGRSIASMRKVVIDAPWVDADRIDAGVIAIEGARLLVGRSADGAIHGGGIEPIVAAAAAAALPTSLAAQALASAGGEPATASAPTTRPALPLLSLDSLTVSDVNIALRDDAVAGSADLTLSLDQLRLANIANYPRNPDKPSEFSVVMALPGIARRVQVVARATPFAHQKNAQATIQISGIKLDAMKPYLTPLGIESEFKDGVLLAEISGGFATEPDGWLKGDIQLKQLSLTDSQELFRWNGAKITGCRIDPRTLEVHIAAIDLTGPALTCQRDASGSMQAFGFRTVPAKPGKVIAASTPPAATAPATSPLPIPRIAIDRFTWKDLKLRLTDATVKPTVTMEVQDAGIELTGIDLATGPTTRPAIPAGLKAWLRAPGLARRVDITGTVTPGMDAAAIDLKLDSDGLTGAALSPYLSLIGIEPVVKNGRLKLQARADVKLAASNSRASVCVRDLVLADGERELGGIDLFEVGSLTVSPNAIVVDRVQITHPRLAVTRDAEGRLESAGLRLDPRLTGAKPAAAPATAPTIPATSPAPAAAATMVATVGSLRIEDARLNWTDGVVRPAAAAIVHTDLAADGLTFGKDAQPAKLSITTWADGILQKMTVQGTIQTGPNHQSLDWAIRGTGQQIGTLAPYLPPTLACTLRDGRFTADLSADITPAHKGGVSLKAAARNVTLSEGDYPLASIGEASLFASRLDADQALLAFDSLKVLGAQLEAHRTPDGNIAVAGVTTRVAPPAPPAEPIVHSATRPATGRADADVATLVAASRARMPLITLNTLDLRMDQCRFVDDMRPAAAPIVVRDIRLANRAPLAWLGPDPLNQPPNDLELTLGVDDLIDNVTVRMLAAPFAAQPYARISKSVTGIHGAKLSQFVPETAGLIDGSSLVNATFKADMDVTMRVERRGPTQLDFARDFEIAFALRNVEFKDQQGPVLLGVSEINIPAVKVNPGNASIVIPSVDITKPIFHAWREKDGLHVLGLRVLMPTPATQPATTAQPDVAQAKPAASVTPAPAAASSPPPVEGEILIRKLTISGIDTSFEDRSVDPQVLFPLTGLEVEAFDISSLATSQKRTMRFSSTLTAGKVMLPNQKHHATGSDQRPVFAQITTNGQLTLYPQRTGWVKNSISGMELVAFKGLAKEQGITLRRGMLDVDTDVRIGNNQNILINTRTVVNDLSISEDDNGPIRRLLKLSAPLTTAINLVEDADGSITLPLSVSIRNGEVSRTAIVGSVLAATGHVIATAIASAPMKLIGSLTGGSEKKPTRQTTVELDFAAGSATVEADDVARLAAALEPYRFDRNAEITISHDLGIDDVTMAARRANPDADDAMALVTQLRDRRDRLMQRRREQESRVRTELAMYSALAVRPTLDELRSTCRAITQTEDALDRVLELFRPGADHLADRRTRAAALVLADQRLTESQAAIANARIGTLASRISKANPRFVPSETDKAGKVTVKIVSRPH